MTESRRQGREGGRSQEEWNQDRRQEGVSKAVRLGEENGCCVARDSLTLVALFLCDAAFVCLSPALRMRCALLPTREQADEEKRLKFELHKQTSRYWIEKQRGEAHRREETRKKLLKGAPAEPRGQGLIMCKIDEIE